MAKGALASLLGFGGKKEDPAEPADGARYSKGKEPEEVDAESESEPDMDEDYDANFASFAAAAGIPEARRATAEAALKRFVLACKDDDSGPETDDTEA